MVRDTDNGWRRVMGAIRTVAGTVEAGVIGEAAWQKHPNSKLTVADLGAVHEYGLGVPERSFIRDFFDDGQVPVAAAEMVAELTRGNITVAEFRKMLGTYLVEGMQKRMDEGIDPPLLPETINAKEGPPVPLEDTLTLRNKLTYRWSS